MLAKGATPSTPPKSRYILSKEQVQKAYLKAQASMVRLNLKAAELMHECKAHGATDVTGFGFLGHAGGIIGI